MKPSRHITLYQANIGSLVNDAVKNIHDQPLSPEPKKNKMLMEGTRI